MADFEETYRTHVNAVFRYALRTVGNRELAEDITSEAFLELFRHQDSIDSVRLPAWLFTVVKNRAVDYWRKRAVEQRHAQELVQVESPSGSGFDVEAWLLREPALKPVHRVCLVLHFVQGMTREEIGRRLDLSEIKVKGHLQYALHLLRTAWNSASSKGGLGELDASRARRAGALD